MADSVGVYSADQYWQIFINACLANRSYFFKHPIQLLKFIAKILRRPIYHKRQIEFGKNVNFLKEASEIKIPTTIIWGEKDRLISLWQGQKLHSLIPNSKLIILKGINHDWILNRPELFWDNV